MKILVFYATTLAMLFGSLTVLFNALGVGSAAPPPVQTATLAEILPENQPEELAEEINPFAGIDHPFLLPERYYIASQPVTLVTDFSGAGSKSRVLPAGGVFRIQERIDAPDTLWYRVAVSNGQREFSYLLRALDLNWMEVSRFYPRGRPTQRELHEETAAEYILGLKEFDIAQYRPQREFDTEELSVDPGPQESSIPSRKLLASGLSTFNSQGWFSASLLAGVVTLFTAGVLGMVAWYRVTHRWASGRQIEALWTDDAPDMDEPSEEPVRQARIAHEPAEKNRNPFE
jgi:hypothetical protein